MPKIAITYELPENLFPFLKRYERQQAKVFFGQSYATRDLYNKVIDAKIAPIVLLYGQSGVGKSSLLDAGLHPRLDKSHIVKYVRRDSEKGLLKNLEEALATDYFEKNPTEEKGLSLLDKWHKIKKQEEKPLLLILDQIEEVFTRPIKYDPKELEKFFKVLTTIFGNSKQASKGKLILGYRKEFHPEIEESFKNHKLPRIPLFLQYLNRKDIVKIFKELGELPKYNILVEETDENQLPEVVADDLLEDKTSPVAPILQILLTKMWKQARESSSQKAEFTQELYQELKGDGYLLADFFFQQMGNLKNWNKKVVTSCLALGVLYDHTTKLGSAGQKHRDEITERYSYVEKDLLDGLIRKLKELYLLSDSGKKLAL